MGCIMFLTLTETGVPGLCAPSKTLWPKARNTPSFSQTGQRLPDGAVVTNAFLANGLMQKTWGSRLYPVEYTFD